MKMFVRCHLFLLLMLFSTPSDAETGPPEREMEPERAANLYTEFDFETFREHPEALQPIDFEDVDYDLLSAATFHETNRKRVEHDLPTLGYRPELGEAARIQARGMARSGTVSHRHPDDDVRMLADRLEAVGLQAAFSAENVAMSFGIQYEPGRPVVTRQEDGRRFFSYQPTGDLIPPHTYLSYAQSLLEQWMESPGHRENILNPEPEQLGAGHEHSRNELGMDIFYSVQVFFTELDVPPGAEVVPTAERSLDL